MIKIIILNIKAFLFELKTREINVYYDAFKTSSINLLNN